MKKSGVSQLQHAFEPSQVAEQQLQLLLLCAQRMRNSHNKRERGKMATWVIKTYRDRYQYWSIELAIPKVALRDYPDKIREEIEYFVRQMKRIHSRCGTRESSVKVRVLLSEYAEEKG